MKQIYYGYCLWLCLLCWGLSAAQAQTRKDLAIFFPVTTYPKGSGWSDLPETLTECQNIASDLEQGYGFATEVLRNQTKTQIEDKLAALAKQSFGAQDQLLLFFSMHGHFDELGDGGSLIPAGGLRDDPALRTWLLHSNLRYLVSRIQCPHILLVIDACYSGTFQGNKGAPGGFPETTCEDKINIALSGKTRLYISAGGKEKVPAASELAKRFRSALASNGGEDGLLSFQELQIYLSDAAPSPRWGEFTGHDNGGFIFVPKNGCGKPYLPPASNPDQTACQSARRQNTLEAWDYYLALYPQGTCAGEAKDHRAWRLAGRMGTRAAYQTYLDTYPNGIYANEAREKVRIDNMVLVRGGTFQMGSTDGEEDEKPVHPVTVSDFYLGKYEVTVAEFRAFVEATSHSTDAEKDDGSYFWEDSKWQKKPGINWRHDAEGKIAQDNHPVLHVSWNDAIAYCQWLSKQTGQNYRLPTEAEWEYAAGNGSKHTKYSWGNEAPKGKKGGSLADETGATHFNWTKSATNIFLGYQDGFVATAPVGSFDPNGLGLYDMTGNVWEWCSDWYDSDFYKNSSQNNPTGAASGTYRVLRGRSWCNYPQYCRVANRSDSTPSVRDGNIGFRLARTR